MWELDIKKAKHQRSDAFKLWCWTRLLRVTWTAKRSNQCILEKINPEYSMEGLMLKRQYFGHLMQTADWLEKNLKLGKIESRRRGLQCMRWLDSIPDSMHMILSKLWETVKDRGKNGVLQSTGVAKSWKWLSDWTKEINLRKAAAINFEALKASMVGGLGNFLLVQGLRILFPM